MGINTNIEWTHHTFNPWRGCKKVHTGCTNCYADRQSKRNPAQRGVWGEEGQGGTRVVAAEDMWREPRKWNKAAEAAGERHRVFCASLADVFEDWQGPIGDSNGNVLFAGNSLSRAWRDVGNPQVDQPLSLRHVRARLFALIDSTPWLDWQLLTKRPENVRKMWPARVHASGRDVAAYWDAIGRSGVGPIQGLLIDDGAFRPNVWIGTSVSDQETADTFVPELLKLRDLTRVLFLSAEPLVGPVSFRWASWQAFSHSGSTDHLDGLRELDWVIVGGESGPKARRCDIQWIRSILQQCKAAQVPCFVKQLGGLVQGRNCDASLFPGYAPIPPQLGQLETVLFPLRDLKGGDPEEWPEDLRVREFPLLERAVTK